MKNNKIKIEIVLAIILVLIIGVVVYNQLKKDYWAFTPAYNQRQTANNFLNDVYSNKMSLAYADTSNNFLKNNSITAFTKQESSLVGSNFKTTLSKYYIHDNQVLITGIITNVSNGAVYSLNMNFVNGKIDSVLVAPSSS